jgi:hypothetical protein
MKNRILLPLACFLLFLNSNLKAQEFKYGLVGGVDLTNVTCINSSNFEEFTNPYSPMISFNINGYLGYKSSGFWGISIEPGFIQKGGLRQHVIQDNNVDVRYQFNYLQIPIYLDLYITKKMFLSFGPEVSYMISYNSNPNVFSYDNVFLYDYDFELSGSIVFNYNFHKNFDIGLKYNHGITHFNKITWRDAQGNEVGKTIAYNHYLQAFIRFKI